MKIVIIALTTGGKKLAEKILALQADCFFDKRDIPVFEKISDCWKQRVDGIICIMATGIVVRAINSVCHDKTKDPCILVLDENGQFVISLLSGHLGGGNQLATKIATQIGAQAVITTASDVTGHTALDLWAKKNNLFVENSKKLTEKSAHLINTGKIKIYSDCTIESLPDDFEQVTEHDCADIIVSHTVFPRCDALFLRPGNLAVGIGCNRNTPQHAIHKAVHELFVEYRFSMDSIHFFASIDLKNDEQGLLNFATKEDVVIKFYNKDQLNGVENVSISTAVLKATGAKGVAEPAAILAAGSATGTGKLIVRKKKWKDVTAAVAIKEIHLVA